jgi:hypothetical protein
MKNIIMRKNFVFCFCALLTLSACSHDPSAIDQHFGSAVRDAMQRQTAPPRPSDPPQISATSDGQSAKSAIDRYQKSFDVIPPPANVFNIGVGNGSGTAP